MSGPIQEGEIYFDKYFQFKDSASGRKLFVVLRSPRIGEQVLLLKTTSDQPGNYAKAATGCNSDIPVFKLTMEYHKSGLDKTTYIELVDFFDDYSAEEMQEFIRLGDITRINRLNDQVFRELMNCIQRVKSQLVPLEYHSMLFS